MTPQPSLPDQHSPIDSSIVLIALVKHQRYASKNFVGNIEAWCDRYGLSKITGANSWDRTGSKPLTLNQWLELQSDSASIRKLMMTQKKDSPWITISGSMHEVPPKPIADIFNTSDHSHYVTHSDHIYCCWEYDAKGNPVVTIYAWF